MFESKQQVPPYIQIVERSTLEDPTRCPYVSSQHFGLTRRSSCVCGSRQNIDVFHSLSFVTSRDDAPGLGPLSRRSRFRLSCSFLCSSPRVFLPSPIPTKSEEVWRDDGPFDSVLTNSSLQPPTLLDTNMVK